jgi:hypothetical protein
VKEASNADDVLELTRKRQQPRRGWREVMVGRFESWAGFARIEHRNRGEGSGGLDKEASSFVGHYFGTSPSRIQ